MAYPTPANTHHIATLRSIARSDQDDSPRGYDATGRLASPTTASAIPHWAAAATNPLVVVEVLSPSSEGDDDGDKRRDFQSLASLQAYVLAAQDARCVRVYRCTERGEWRDAPDVYRDSDSFELPGLARAIAVDEVYDDILDATGCSLLR